MPVRIVIDDQVVYEGESIPVPRVGDTIERAGEARPIEAVTWELGDHGPTVTLLLAEQPYAY
jgi:hypothetical protein